MRLETLLILNFHPHLRVKSQILPDFLSPDFAIMVDDCGRKGEQNLVEELKDLLTKNEIHFSEGKYRAGAGQYVQVLASESWKFATTL